MNSFLEGLAKLSPVIGTALGGPVGGVIGQTVSIAARAITGKEQPDDILQDLVANPEKLAELEMQTQANELEELRIHAADRDSARGMSVELAKAGHGSAWSSSIVSLVVTIGFVFILSRVINAPVEINDAAFIMLGSLAAAFGQVVSYWLGSSKGSSDKTAIMARSGK